MARTPTHTKSAIHPALLSAQHKLFWDERENPPGVDSARFLLRVMDLGTWQMVRAMEKTFSRGHLREVMRRASHGALSRKSWNFWCHRLDVDFSYPDRFAIRGSFPAERQQVSAASGEKALPGGPKHTAEDASVRDALATKLKALCGRAEPKDLTDIAKILKRSESPVDTLQRGLSDLQFMYVGANAAITLKTLCWFDSPELQKLGADVRKVLVETASATEDLPPADPGSPTRIQRKEDGSIEHQT